jgi:DNA-binding NtrC family response regulator
MNRPPSPLENALSNRLRGGGASPARLPILVIDDDETTRDSLAFILADQYHVTVCASANDGVAAVHEDVCVVILDVRMPEKDGFVACAEIRQKVPDVPVIFYSAHQSFKDPYEIINDHHPFGYVAKGEDLQKIVKLVSQAVSIHSIVVSNRKVAHTLKNTQAPAR